MDHSLGHRDEHQVSAELVPQRLLERALPLEQLQLHGHGQRSLRRVAVDVDPVLVELKLGGKMREALTTKEPPDGSSEELLPTKASHASYARPRFGPASASQRRERRPW